MILKSAKFVYYNSIGKEVTQTRIEISEQFEIHLDSIETIDKKVRSYGIIVITRRFNTISKYFNLFSFDLTIFISHKRRRISVKGETIARILFSSRTDS